MITQTPTPSKNIKQKGRIAIWWKQHAPKLKWLYGDEVKNALGQSGLAIEKKKPRRNQEKY